VRLSPVSGKPLDDVMTDTVKIHILLNDPDLPHGESLRGERLGRNRFRVRNIPFYARDLALDDVVSCIESDGQLTLSQVVRSSGNGTIRIYCGDGYDSGVGAEIIRELTDRGFIFEYLDNLAAGNIPASFDDLAWLESFLDQRYSEACFYEIPKW